MANPLSVIAGRAGESYRLQALIVGAATLAVIWSLVRWGMAPGWVPVAPGLTMDRLGDATQRLDESGIEYRLERGGTLMTVPDRDVARARVLLASEGLTGSAAAPGYEIFNEPSWSMTDFTQRVNYQRALKGELERTIGSMRGIESVQVQLTLQERSFLRSDGQSSTASVVLGLYNDAKADDSVVEGIQSLVASAVGGLTRDNVSVLDARGRLLSDESDDTGAGLSNAQLRVRTQIERYLEDKAEAVVAQVVGGSNATIRVSADLNFDQIDRTTQAVDPNQSTLMEEQRAEITPGDESQGAGSVQSNAVFETTRSLETVSRGGARLERLTVAVVVGDRRVGDGGGDATFQPRTAQELQQIQTLVSNAVGLLPGRGDQISVVSARLDEVDPAPILPAPAGVDVAAVLMAAQRPVVALAGFGVALLLSLRLLGTVTPPTTSRQAAGGAPQVTDVRSPHQALPPSPQAAPQMPPIVPPATVKVADPQMTARVMKSWMKENV